MTGPYTHSDGTPESETIQALPRESEVIQIALSALAVLIRKEASRAAIEEQFPDVTIPSPDWVINLATLVKDGELAEPSRRPCYECRATLMPTGCSFNDNGGGGNITEECPTCGSKVVTQWTGKKVTEGGPTGGA